jgi:Chaperone of endosialidase
MPLPRPPVRTARDHAGRLVHDRRMQISILRAFFSCLVLLAAAAALAGCGSGDDGGGPPDSGAPQWFTTCGDPACGGYTPTPGATVCTDQQVGQACGALDTRCEIPDDSCNADLLCTTSDPATNCPISQARFKHAIEYLGGEERGAAAAALLDLRLATYRYRGARDDGRRHLGFVIDDLPAGSPAVHVDGRHVDLYGYTSMAVAALQTQAEHVQRMEDRMAELEREVDTLRRSLDAAPVCTPAP